MDLKTTYNQIARDWHADHSEGTWWVKGTDKFLSYLEPGSSILDVGCGAGIKANYILNKGFKVTGIDFSEEMINLSKQNVPAGAFFVKDIKQPLEFEVPFAGIFANAILLHFPKTEVAEILKHITAPLEQGGYLYAAVKELQPGQPDERMEKENDYGYEYERFYSYFSVEELNKYIIQNDMSVVFQTLVPIGKTNRIQIIAQKT